MKKKSLTKRLRFWCCLKDSPRGGTHSIMSWFNVKCWRLKRGKLMERKFSFVCKLKSSNITFSWYESDNVSWKKYLSNTQYSLHSLNAPKIYFSGQTVWRRLWDQYCWNSILCELTGQNKTWCICGCDMRPLSSIFENLLQPQNLWGGWGGGKF